MTRSPDQVWCTAPEMTSEKRNVTSDALEVATVGLPFCAFKGLVGQHLVVSQGYALGYGLIALAAVDAAFNLVNLGALATLRRRAWSTCLLSAVSQRSRLFTAASHEFLADFGSSLDVLLSFTLVAAMVGFSQIGTMPPDHVALWNGAVVLNVLGAGLSRFRESVTRRPRSASQTGAPAGSMTSVTSEASSSGETT
jgi:hypothetical protein